MDKLRLITPCLWFDHQAEEAVRFYTSVFSKKNAKIGTITHYPAVGQEEHGMEAGTVMTVEFEIDGQSYVALNGGPMFQFTEALSLQVICDTQEEIDYYWNALLKGGSESQCGWLKDKYGLSWQVVPRELMKMIADPDREKQQRAFEAMMGMVKFDIAELKRAYEGVATASRHA